MIEIWHVRVFSGGDVYDDDSASLEAAKVWASEKLAELGHDVVELNWSDTTQASRADLGSGVEANITLRTE